MTAGWSGYRLRSAHVCRHCWITRKGDYGDARLKTAPKPWTLTGFGFPRIGNKQAWNALVWFATLVALADGLSRIGFVAWIAGISAAHMSGMSPVTVMIMLVVVFFVVHYLFASLTAHTTAILPLILAAGVAVPGLPIRPFALLLCFSLGIMGVLNPYATGPAPVYFGSGYVNRRDFWLLGFVFGALFLLALLGIGAPILLFAK